eukprot:COSAG02_NODE_35183_length_472_cov_0.965147_1_plen_68_part_00
MIKWAVRMRWGIGSQSIYQSAALVVVVLLWRGGVDGGTIDQSWDIGRIPVDLPHRSVELTGKYEPGA